MKYFLEFLSLKLRIFLTTVARSANISTLKFFRIQRTIGQFLWLLNVKYLYFYSFIALLLKYYEWYVSGTCWIELETYVTTLSNSTLNRNFKSFLKCNQNSYMHLKFFEWIKNFQKSLKFSKSMSILKISKIYREFAVGNASNFIKCT